MGPAFTPLGRAIRAVVAAALLAGSVLVGL